MDFIRTSVLRRGGPDGQSPDAEQQLPLHVEEPPQTRTRRFPISRPALPTILMGRTNSGRRGTVSGSDGNVEDDESPKTSRFGRIRLPSVTRTRTRDVEGSPSRGSTDESGGPSPRASLTRTRTERFPVVAQPESAHTNEETTGHGGRTRFRGTDPAELHLADLAERGRRRRHGSDGSRGQRREPPKRFLFCFPWIKSKRVRGQILRCFVSGLFLFLMLAVYLSLSITKNINSSEFTILLILIILFTTIFFCHGLVRLCLMIIRPRDEAEERMPMPEMFGPGGYAIPRRPIRVLLARDEEAAGLESDSTKLQPPAYGLWRESVRVDPDRIYWQRNEEQGAENGESARPRTGQPRPPSYASEDGVEYVVEARPRSMAPMTDLQLPPHPSEAASAQHMGRPNAW
ncbi:hypothetical protein F5Y15DRAFT_49820 [Xylariaceae sp. FL0016]|nr:hypothetical protein F5Y15DRAFT_49820 [Xylariaceae sp. FL0016]